MIRNKVEFKISKIGLIYFQFIKCPFLYAFTHVGNTPLFISDITEIKDILMRQYDHATRQVPVLPLDEDEGLSLSEIYEPVLLTEDLSAMTKTRRPDELSGTIPIHSIKDVFYVNQKLAQKIVLKGEAGYGKTVFCLMLIETWSKDKRSPEFTYKIDSDGSANAKLLA